MPSLLAADALTTLENLKAVLNVSTSDTSEDPYLERLINRASRWVESETERRSPDGKYGLKARRYNGAAASAPDNLHPTTKVPDENYVYFSGSTKDHGGDTVIDEGGYGLFFLPAWPVQANSVLTFQLASLSDRDSGLVGGESWDTDGLVEFDDYAVERESGVLRLLGGRLTPGFRNYRVQMAAGYQTGDAQPYVPDDLEQLTIELCRMLYRDTKNVRSESMAGLARTFGEAMQDPFVRQTIGRYKRFSL